MAEIIAVAGVSITVPMVLNASWTVLKAAYSLYGNVDMRRKQIRLLLDRCQDIIAKLSKRINDNPEALTTAMQADMENLQKCVQVYLITASLPILGLGLVKRSMP